MSIIGKAKEFLTVERVIVDPPSNQNIPDDRLIDGVVYLRMETPNGSFVYEHKFKNKKDTIDAISDALRTIGGWAGQVAQQASSRVASYDGVRS